MKRLPENVIPFVLDGLPPLHKFDQRMMRKLRKQVDRTGLTVEGYIREAIAKFVANHSTEEGLEGKIISFFRETRL
jgi:hypothetical protein